MTEAATVPPGIFKAYDVRGLYGDEMDGEIAYLVGRAFARVLAGMRGKETSELRVGLGRDMRIEAPEMAGRLRDGLVDEGCAVLDAGMVAHRDALFPGRLAPARRRRDGHRLAQPEGLHRRQARPRGRARPSPGDAGIGEIRAMIEAGMPDPPRRRVGRGARRLRRVPPPRPVVHRGRDGEAPPRSWSTGATGWPGPMAGPVLERLGLDLDTTYWVPDGEFPDHEPEPAAGGEPPVHHRPRARRRAPTSGSPGTATPTAASSSTTRARSSTATSSRRSSPARCWRRSPGRRSSTTSAPAGPSPTRSASWAATSDVNRVGHAFFKAALRERDAAFGGEVSGHYYFRDFWCADSGTIPALLVLELLSIQKRSLSELVGYLRERYFISGEINSEVADQRGEDEGDRRAPRRRRGELARRRLRRLPGLALQRAAVEHRAAAAPEPGVAGLARGHGAKARRSSVLDVRSARDACRRRRSRAARPPRRASTASRSRPRSPSAG